MDYDYVKAWIENDPDDETKAQLSELLENNQTSEIETLFASRLSFGTAGLRAELGAGPMRMNRLVVSQTAQGIADFLNQNKDLYLDPNGELSAVIGFDARKNSQIFAQDSAEILQASGIEVELFDQHVPTPVVAFTAKQKQSSLAIVVTASHNPPNDNGYKVYLGGANGNSQIIPPQDAEIAQAIDAVKEINPSNRSSGYKKIGPEQIKTYLHRCDELAAENQQSELKIVYTAMHGVGWDLMKEIFKQAGFTNIYPVAEQMHPDPNFPTVQFPNPEEPGAMDLALAEARKVKADLIIANDPDADRLAVGVKTKDDYRMLSGNELGILLADFVTDKHQHGSVAASYVSSQQIISLAGQKGFDHQLTPTGFKWIAKVENLVFGFEEALGYCVDPKNTPDKDGLTAALYSCLIAAELSREGLSIDEKLEQIAVSTGYFETSQISIRLQSINSVQQLVKNLKKTPKLNLSGKSASIIDLSENDPRLDMLEIRPDENSRALIRASGTEPKLKCYLETTGSDRAEAKKAMQELDALMSDFLKQ
ncbi:MAG: phospho-sugar mutase [Microbacteriaceae bacterium]|nr:phospho-sugar mutase [Microbacteriaceae bacterium]